MDLFKVAIKHGAECRIYNSINGFELKIYIQVNSIYKGQSARPSSFYSPLVVRMTGLLVVVINVLMAARNPESSSKITSTSSNSISEVAVFLLCSSLFLSLWVLAAGKFTAGSLSLLPHSRALIEFLQEAVCGNRSKALF